MADQRDNPAVTYRAARVGDARAIVALIELNVASGELLPRTPEFVEMQVTNFVVAERGGVVIGCAHLDEYAPSLAEVRSLAVAPDAQGLGAGAGLVRALERLARTRDCSTVFAVSNSGDFFRRLGYAERHIPELDRERSAVSKYKGVHAKDLAE